MISIKFLFWIVFLLAHCLPRLLTLLPRFASRKKYNKIAIIWVSSRFEPMVVSHPLVPYPLYSSHTFIEYLLQIGHRRQFESVRTQV